MLNEYILKQWIALLVRSGLLAKHEIASAIHFQATREARVNYEKDAFLVCYR